MSTGAAPSCGRLGALSMLVAIAPCSYDEHPPMTDVLTRLITGDVPERPAAGGAEDRSAMRRLNQLVIVLLVIRVAAMLFLMLSHQDTVDGGIAGDVRRYV